MDPKHTGSAGDARATAAAAKKRSASRVKVVASRYAQVLQSKNIESHAARGLAATGAPPAASRAAGGVAKATSQSTPSTAAGANRIRVHGTTSVRATPSSAYAHSARPKSNSHLVMPVPTTKRPRISTASADVDANPPGQIFTTPAPAASEFIGQDLKERLKAYKAIKSLPIDQRQPSTPSIPAMSASVSKPRAIVKSPTVRERPTFPKRISSGAERSTKRPAKVASQPTPVETTVLAPRPSGSTTPRVRASSAATSLLSRSQPQQTEEDELELLEAMYYQLCFTEMRAKQAFRQQEQSAEVSELAFSYASRIGWKLT